MKTVAVVSGGMDSVTLAHWLASRQVGDTVHLASIDYGQRHGKELAFAERCASDLGAPWTRIDLTALRPILAGSALTDVVEVPEGHYAADTMKATVVPNRNAILISVAAGLAVSVGADRVAVGVHSGDHPIYPDCRPAFIEAMSRATGLGTEGLGPLEGLGIAIIAPFVEETKADICKLGDQLGIDWTRTWSCYQGGDRHCGRCGTCVERAEAFHLAGVPDPTDYVDPAYWRQAVGAS